MAGWEGCRTRVAGIKKPRFPGKEKSGANITEEPTMNDLEEMVKDIRFERERQFALTFFDHKKWVHEPRFFYLSDGTKYHPDFYDAKRDVYIEVIGSRQAFYQNREKYTLFCKEYPSINFEFRTPDGKLVEQENMSLRLATPREKYKGGIRRQKEPLKNMGGASRLQEITDRLGLSLESVSTKCGISFYTVRAHYYGLRKTMTLPLAAKYAEGLGVSIQDLMGLADK